MAEKRPYVKQRQDVQDLNLEIQKLTKSQEGWFSSLLTSGDAFKEQVDMAKAINEELKNSNQYSSENNKLAENRAAAAKMMVGYGKRQTFIQKAIQKGQLIALKNTRKQQDFEDDVTDAMIERIESQEESIDLAEKFNSALDAADDLFGGMGSTIKDFLTNPLTGIVGILLSFGALTDQIGESFGAIGVTKFRGELGQANIAMTEMGISSEELFQSMEKLQNSFSVSLGDSIEMGENASNLAKSLGLSSEHGAELVGYFSEVQGMSSESAMNLMKSTASLAEANGVAPNVVMEDIANNTEVFARFAKDGGKGLLRAAIQARKLGISLDKVAGTADGLLDFQTSLNNEIEASIMLGRDVNLQKARELALSGDLEGLQKEIVNVLGDEAEWNEMNALQRDSLAKALNMESKDLDKIIRKEKEQVTLAGELAKQDISNLIPDETMSDIAKTINELKAFGLTLIEEYGPKLMDMFNKMKEPIAATLKSFIGWVKKIEESYGWMNILKTAAAAMVAKSIISLGIQVGTAYAKGAAALGAGAIPALMLAAVAVPMIVQSILGGVRSIKDGAAMGGGPIISRPAGSVQLSKNDDFIAGTKLFKGNTGGNSNRENSRLMGTLIDEVKRLRQSTVTQHKETWGPGGSAARDIGTRVGEGTLKARNRIQR